MNVNKKIRIEKANHALLIAKFAIWKSNYMDGISLESIFEKEIERRMKFFKK